jgi:hypothetical protein
MRKIPEKEIMMLEELLWQETVALSDVKAGEALVMDDNLKSLVTSNLLTIEKRIHTLQQIIKENNIIGWEVN